jgi:hypothetical protein
MVGVLSGLGREKKGHGLYCYGIFARRKSLRFEDQHCKSTHNYVMGQVIARRDKVSIGFKSLIRILGYVLVDQVFLHYAGFGSGV